MTDFASTPDTPVTPDTYTPRMFAWRGRIGRLRYLAYVLGLGLLTTVPPMFLVALLAKPESSAYIAVQVLVSVASVVVSVLLGRRRLNDMGHAGWQAFGMIIPLVNVVVFLWIACARGDAGPNRHGPAPGPNTPGIVAAALLFVALLVIGVVAAFVSGPHPGYQNRNAPSGQVL
ncbi:uncharacterized membrane protein YhaH (DUF805 family) [Pseudoduganella flava]|uniref:DUF805 domain-containing protein n=1 Tax=Pseudoduganella flava TaxID=871742 RepID=A0A562PLK7_9BURK|nr:DUF805 domain-containing protein [Pseudoduganella flava]QGZ41036.1 DUF805 domain-containing protein [Pseudoduganella flava]TWI45268.1 uncharacterized membrane protein YhaH (DUF805 family) [Pseudoduganella flava]